MNAHALTQHLTVRRVLQALLGSMAIAVASQLTVPLPFGLVPFSLQNVAVLGLAALFGRKVAFASVAAFLLEGACGLPVFSLGSSGLVSLLGPRGGYLASYLLVAYTVGTLYNRSYPFASRFLILLLGSLITLSLGTAYLASFIGWGAAFATGCVPFLLIEAAKAFGLASLLSIGRRTR